MDSLEYILNKFSLRKQFEEIEKYKMPIEIVNFGRDQLAELFRELALTSGAEIGVEQGVYSKILLEANPRLQLYAIDAWKSYRGYRDHTSQRKLDDFYQITKDRLKQFNHRCNILRGFSLDLVKQFGDESLDFVYIDSNHNYYNTVADIHHWIKKVKIGGIISGHDYTKYKDANVNIHVVQAVQGYTDAYRIKPWFVLGSNAEVPGQIRDKARSWMWVRMK
jgi:hypothetical protein